MGFCVMERRGQTKERLKSVRLSAALQCFSQGTSGEIGER